MKILFSNTRCMLLIRGSITLLIAAIMVTIFLASPLETPPTYAHRTATHPKLGTTKTAFSDFCYAAFTNGLRTEGLSCLKLNRDAMTFLQKVMSAASFGQWPQTYSLATLAQKGLLFQPQSQTTLIKTQQDFLNVILQFGSQNLQALFVRGTHANRLLVSLWTYQPVGNNAPPPVTPPVNASDQPPSCPGNFQSFQNSDLWPTFGPQLLTAASQSMADQNGQHIGVYDVYGRLLLQNQCSMASLALTMKTLVGEPNLTASTVAEWERTELSTIANSPSVANNPSVKGIFCLLGSSDDNVIDSWFSAAIMTHPITALTAPTAPTTSGSGSTNPSPGTVQVN